MRKVVRLVTAYPAIVWGWAITYLVVINGTLAALWLHDEALLNTPIIWLANGLIGGVFVALALWLGSRRRSSRR